MNENGAKDRQTLFVSLEPRSYSEVIGYTIEALRPRLAVEVVQPDSLCSEVERVSPEIVLCSRPYRDCGGSPGSYWVEYYPYAEPPAEPVRVNGEGSGLVNVEINDLLMLVDHAETLHGSS